jgi:hypothetical protein
VATIFTDATSAPLLEPPGSLLINYEPRTPLLMTIVHVAYGSIVGGLHSRFRLSEAAASEDGLARARPAFDTAAA